MAPTSSDTCSLHLHAHLPFVRHPEYEDFLEEDWLYEAISETYLPLLRVFDRADRRGHPVPHLAHDVAAAGRPCSRDELLMSALRAAAGEAVRAGGQGGAPHPRRPDLPSAGAATTSASSASSRALFNDRYHRDLVLGLPAAGGRGPARAHAPAARPTASCRSCRCTRRRCGRRSRWRCAHHRRHFGRRPGRHLAAGVRLLPRRSTATSPSRTSASSSSTRTASPTPTPRPRYGVYAPIYTPDAASAAFARDPESSMQVWSAESGYPGDPDYREFYRDVGWDLDFDYVTRLRAARPGSARTSASSTTGSPARPRTSSPTIPSRARERAAEHAGNFMFNREQQIEHLAARMGGTRPSSSSPYDAELYGHWWFEGPDVHRLPHPEDRLRPADVSGSPRPATTCASTPSSRWRSRRCRSGATGGYAEVWLDGSNDWIYRHLHKAAERMVELARDYPEARAACARRALEPGRARAAAGAVERLGLHHEDRDHGGVRHPRARRSTCSASRGSTTRSGLGADRRELARRTSRGRTTSSRRSTGGCTGRSVITACRPGRSEAAGARLNRGVDLPPGRGLPSRFRFSVANRGVRGLDMPEELGSTEREIVAQRVRKAEELQEARGEPVRERPRAQPPRRRTRRAATARRRRGRSRATPGSWSIAGRVSPSAASARQPSCGSATARARSRSG